MVGLFILLFIQNFQTAPFIDPCGGFRESAEMARCYQEKSARTEEVLVAISARITSKLEKTGGLAAFRQSQEAWSRSMNAWLELQSHLWAGGSGATTAVAVSRYQWMRQRLTLLEALDRQLHL